MSECAPHFAKALELLPHGPELRLVDEVLEFGNAMIVCRAVKEPHESMCVIEANGQRNLSPMSFVEYISQTAAIGKIMQSVAAGDLLQRQGAVVRVRNLNFTVEPIAADSPLEIAASWSSSVAGAFEVKGSVVDAKSRAVLGEGSLFIVEF